MLSFREYLTERYRIASGEKAVKAGLAAIGREQQGRRTHPQAYFDFDTKKPTKISTSHSGQAVWRSGTNTLGMQGHDDDWSHAVLIQNAIWTGIAHIDGIQGYLNHFGKNDVDKDALAHKIDSGKIPIEFGYYYDGEFHYEPKDFDMAY